MAVDLRDFVQAQQASQGLVDAASGYQQQQAQQAMQQQAPGLLGSGNPADLGKLALLASNAGDPSILRSYVQGQDANQKAQIQAQMNAKNAVLDDPNAKAMAATAESLSPGAGAAFMPGIRTDIATANLNALKAKYGSDNTLEGKQSAADAKAGQVTDKQANQAAAQMGQTMAKTLTKLQDSESALNTTYGLFKQNPTKAAIGDLKMALVKAIANQRITNQELSSFQLKSLPSDAGALMNYLQGTVNATATPEEIAELDRLAQGTIAGAKNKRQQIVGQDLSTLVGSSDYLKNWGGVPGQIHPQAAQIAKDNGLDLSVNNGAVTFKATQPGQKGVDPNSQLGQLIARANKIPDPDIRQNALDNLGGFTVETFPKAKFQPYSDMIDKYSAPGGQ